ncbi:MAG: sensor histidine kinase [bacterium]
MLSKGLGAMRNVTDQSIIFIFTVALYISNENSIYIIIPILVAVIISGFLSYVENETISLAVFAVYLLVCSFILDLIFFIPLITYNVAYISNDTPKKWLWTLSFFPLIVNTNPDSSSKWLIAACIITAYLIKHRTTSLHNREKEYNKLRDNTTEISLKLEKQNKELLARQDYEVNLATATERNRIARDIHDNVGHMLSRSILQIAALLTLDKDKETKKSLKLMKETLSEAMDSIRASVHNLHEESINLQTEVHKLTKNFNFCPIKVEYEIKANPEKKIKYCFIAVIKEALSNIIKHSNASRVSLLIREHPGFYQLVIHDNGTDIDYNPDNGIGTRNINDRVIAVDGYVNISTDNGFRIFISIPKNFAKGLNKK